MKKPMTIAAIILAYATIGFLTGGYYEARREEPQHSMTSNLSPMAGIGWPVYWSARLLMMLGKQSTLLFTPAPPPTVEKP